MGLGEGHEGAGTRGFVGVVFTWDSTIVVVGDGSGIVLYPVLYCTAMGDVVDCGYWKSRLRPF